LVAGDPLAHPRELGQAGKTEEAVNELNTLNSRLGKMLTGLQMHQDDVHNKASLADMMQRISQRRTEIRAEIRKLSSQKKASGSGETQDKFKLENAPIKLEKASTADAGKQAAEQEEAEKRAERSAKVEDLVGTMITNRYGERESFAAVNEELKKSESWFSKPDPIVMANKLNALLPLYDAWDKSVAELKQVFKERGENPDRANQYAPNRAEWQNLYNKSVKL